MDTKRIQQSVEAFVSEVLKKAGSTICVTKEGKKWKAIVELVEEKGFIDDVLGVYEFTLDEQSTVVSYRRLGLRRRSDMSPKDWEKPILADELAVEE
jgi:hypothetical protein